MDVVPSRHSHVPRPLWWLSVLLLLSHAGLVWAYVEPFSAPRPLGDGQVSVVRYIETMGPIWVAAFAASGLAIAATLRWYPPCLRWAHVVGAATLTAYATASWIGAALSQPPAPIIAAVLATSIGAMHYLAAWVAARYVT